MRSRLSTLSLLGALLFAPHLLWAQEVPAFLIGSAVSPEAAERTITLAANTRWVNVVRREAIRFVVGGSSFGWRFDGPGSYSFDLQRVAPPGMLTHPVTAYITFQGELSRTQ